MRLVIVLWLVLAVPAASAAGDASPDSVAPTVHVTPVVSKTLVRDLDLPGELAAFRTVALYPKVQGFVEWIGVDRGSRVRKGEELVRLQAPELAAQASEAEAKVQMVRAQGLETEAKYAADQATYRRLKAASKTPGVVSGNEVEIAQHTAEASLARSQAWRASEKAARDAADAVRNTEGYLKVAAPFDGVVSERNVHEGSLVGPTGTGAAQPMVRVQDVARLRLVVALPESEIGGIVMGDRVVFSVPAQPGVTFSGVVSRKAEAVDVKTRTMPIELDVENADRRIAPGMYAQVKWKSRRPRPTLFVPPSAVVTTTERTFVIAVRDGKTVWVDVKRGATSGHQIEIFGELQAGEKVVARGSDELRAGLRVDSKE